MNTKTLVALAVAGAIGSLAGTASSADIVYDNHAPVIDQRATDGGVALIEGDDRLSVSKTTFKNNQATASDGWGGAFFIRSNHSSEIKQAVFEGNIAKQTGGAVAVSVHSGSNTVLTVTDTTFKNNHALDDGGAVGNFKNMIVSGSLFEGNTAQLTGTDWSTDNINQNNPIGGGAIALGSESVTSIENTTFKNNRSGFNGGAIATRLADNTDGSKNDNSAAKLKVFATFLNNTAESSGGAIFNTFYTDFDSEMKGVQVHGLFVGNKAGISGGAIFNDCTQDINGGNDAGIMTVSNSVFTGNSAGEMGGAIFNDGHLYLSGTNVFAFNTAGGKANDIYNLGHLEVLDGTTILASGIISDNYISTGSHVKIASCATLAVGGITRIEHLIGDASLQGVQNSNLHLLSTDISVDNSIYGLNVSTSGVVSDAINGDYKAVKAMVTDTRAGYTKTIVLNQGLKSGKVTANIATDGTVTIVREKNTFMQDNLKSIANSNNKFVQYSLNDVRKRLGDVRFTGEKNGSWVRYDGGRMSTSGFASKFNTLQIGYDSLAFSNNFRLGGALSYTRADSEMRDGASDVDGYSAALYGTWTADNGMFADVIARIATVKNEMQLTMDGYGLLKGDVDSMVYSLSGEVGQRFAVAESFFVEPQMEVTYSYIDSDDMKLGDGLAKYKYDGVDSLIGRAGLVAGWTAPNGKGHVYARASVLREFMGDSSVSSGLETARADGEDTWTEFGLGAQYSFNKNIYVWADVERTEGAEVNEDFRGTVGVRINF